MTTHNYSEETMSLEQSATPLENRRGRPKQQQLGPNNPEVMFEPTNPPPSKKNPRQKSHGRSMSHNKVAVQSGTPAGGHTARPHLNRSKSTDGLVKTRLGLKRASRSYTKMYGLQPLTKTVSNQSVKSNKSTGSLKGMNASVVPLSGLKTSGRKGKAILRLNDDYENGDYEDLDKTEEIEPVPEKFEFPKEDQQEEAYFEDKNPPPAVTENQQQSGIPKLEKEEPKQTLSESTRSSTDDLQLANNMYGGSLLLSQSTGLTKKFDNKAANQLLHQKLIGADVYTSGNNSIHMSNTDSTLGIPSNQSFMGSNNSESISGISFRANPIDNTQNIAEPVTTNKNVIQNNSYQPNQTIFNNLKRTNSHYLTTKQQQLQLQQQQQQQQQQQHQQQQQQQQQQHQYSQPQHLRPIQKPQVNKLNTDVNNFSTFLNTGKSASDQQSETRTQQRLWLQRENSLMDVSNVDAGNLGNLSSLSLNNLMFAYNYNNGNNGSAREPVTPVNYHGGGSNIAESTLNSSTNTLGNDAHSSSVVNINGLLTMVQNNHQNSIQSRTEFERLNREYLNVRRNLNPVGESLNRVGKYLHSTKQIDVTKKGKANGGNQNGQMQAYNPNNASFKEVSSVYQEKELEITATINRLWQDAVMASLASAQHSPAPRSGANGVNGQQRPLNPRVPSYTLVQNGLGNLRAPQTPTTRAVKLATQAAGSNQVALKRGDLLNISN